jgi:hypothetical protein
LWFSNAGAIADDCMDAGDRAMQEQLPSAYRLPQKVRTAYPTMHGLWMRKSHGKNRKPVFRPGFEKAILQWLIQSSGYPFQIRQLHFIPKAAPRRYKEQSLYLSNR